MNVVSTSDVDLQHNAHTSGALCRCFTTRGVKRWIGAACLILSLGLGSDAQPAAAETPAESAVEASAPAGGGVTSAASHHGTASARTDLATPPASLEDIKPWLDYIARSEEYALPEEARLFYRRGLLAHRSGQQDEAVHLVRGAAELDRTFADPHRTLISWFLFRAPGQALVHSASLLELVRRSFVLQLELAANAIFMLSFTLLCALLAAGMIIVATRNHELRHGWQEHLSRFTGPHAAKKWPWVFLVVPYCVGLGLALPTVAFLGFLWPTHKLRERFLFVLLAGCLAAAPLVTETMGRLARPIDAEKGPFYGTLALENEPYSAAQHRRLTQLAQRHPEQPFLHFALGWSASRAGTPAAAEAAYRRTLELWPEDDRVLNNLGNALALQGRDDEALKLYRRATVANRSNAAAYFNIAQNYTKRFDFRAANEALSHASALDFELVSSHQKQTTEDRPMPLVDQWIGPKRFWNAMLALPRTEPTPEMLPPLWRGRIEFTGWPFSLAVLVAAFLGIGAGIFQHRVLPLRSCGNCDRVVCRRCAQRRREVGLCRSCAAVEARAKAPDFARVLLLEHRRRTHRPFDVTRTVLAILIPGFGLLAFRRIFTPLLLLAASVMLLADGLGVSTPFAYAPHLDFLGQGHSIIATLVPWALIYAISILGYFAERARVEARRNTAAPRQTRGRGTTVLYRVADAA